MLRDFILIGSIIDYVGTIRNSNGSHFCIKRKIYHIQIDEISCDIMQVPVTHEIAV
jgi:hypothetical protein